MSDQMIPYILMNGRGKEAIEYYQEVLGAEVLFQQTFGEGPKDEAAKIKETDLDLIAHAVLKMGGNSLMIADRIPALPFQSGTQVSVCLTTDDIERAQQIYENLQREGRVLIELNAIYFSPAYGMVTDKFGVTFQIYTNRK